MKETLRKYLPRPLVTALRRIIWRVRRKRVAPGGLAGLAPISEVWGLDRGTPIDIYYLERFLSSHAEDIKGRTLETGDSRYSAKFGRDVTRADVLHISTGNPAASIVGDLESGLNIPEAAFDCIILTNTLLLIFDVRAALWNCHRALRPGGVLLVHFSGLVRSQVSARAWGPSGWEGEADYWRFTSAAATRLSGDCFGRDAITVHSYGNVRSVTAALYGLAADELTDRELDFVDTRFELAIGVRAVRRLPT